MWRGDILSRCIVVLVVSVLIRTVPILIVRILNSDIGCGVVSDVVSHIELCLCL